MINQQAVIEHLKQKVSLAKIVEHAYEMEPVDSVSSNAPALFVYPAGERSDPSGYDNLIIQQTAESITVLTVADMPVLEAVRAELLAALIGYQFSPEKTPLEHVEGKPLDARARMVWWRDTFTTSYQRGQSAQG